MDIWDASTAWSGTTMDREYFVPSFNGSRYDLCIGFVFKRH